MFISSLDHIWGKKIEADCTSEHHPCLVALLEATRWAVFPPDLVHNAVISPGTQVAMMACWVKKHFSFSFFKAEFFWIFKHISSSERWGWWKRRRRRGT